MKNLTMNPTSVTMEYIIKSAIYENKMELQRLVRQIYSNSLKQVPMS